MASVSEPQGLGITGLSGLNPGDVSASMARREDREGEGEGEETQESRETPDGETQPVPCESESPESHESPEQPPEQPQPTTLHAHRQNHNCSKLPTFRFADLKKDALLPSRRQNIQTIPPSPISPISPGSPRSPRSPKSPKSPQSPRPPSPAEPCSDAAQDVFQGHQQHPPANPPATPPTDANFVAPTGAASTANTATNNTAVNTTDPLAPTPTQAPVPTNIPEPLPNTLPNTLSPTIPPAISPTIPSVTASSRRPASLPNSPPTVIVSAANPTSSSLLPLSLLSPLSSASASATLDSLGPTRLQRTLTDPVARRAPLAASASSASLAKRVPAVNEPVSASAEPPESPEWANLGSEDQQRDHDNSHDRHDHHELSCPPTDDKKPTSRPPVSFRPPRAIIPPIRSFRSSGSRKSLDLKPMSYRSPGDSDDLHVLDNGIHDRTLRALEGRNDDLTAHSIQSMATVGASDSENTADLFMRIAREDTRKRTGEDDRPENHAMRVTHSASNSASQRRPFSAAVSSHRPTSPPQVVRRHSDQRDTGRTRRAGEDVQPSPSYSRMSTRDRPSPIRTSIAHKPEPIRTARTVVSATRPSPSTPRTSVFFDTASEVGTNYTRRRPSADNASSTIMPARASSIKPTHAHAYTRTYNSSPLATRPDPQRRDSHDAGHVNGNGNTTASATATPSGPNAPNGATGPHGGPDSTESSASTAAPSTVWDELDDLKSRMRRLELSGKIPPTSGAAMSRVSDDRPRTATTNATTMSGSPKRGPNTVQADARSTTSSQLRQQTSQDQTLSQSQQLISLQQSAHPPLQSNLLTALQKAKAQISDEVYTTMETVATEALALSQMVGVAGQPGPISSGASSIGGGGPTTVTDRQLRRKADSICRSLTELCMALNEEATHRKAAAAAAAAVATVTSHVQATVREAREARESREDVAPPAQTTATTPTPAAPAPPSILASPMVSKTFTFTPSYTPQMGLRRSTTENLSPSVPTSPRGSVPRLTEERERRASTFLMTPTMSSVSRHLGPPVSADNIGRRSSLMISRSRRAVSEEPEDMQLAGRRSSLLRSRRAGTEEPEDTTVHGSGRKSSLLRSRRAMAAAASDDEDDTLTTMVTRVMRSPMTTPNTAEAGQLRSAAARERAYQAQAQAQAQAMALAQAQAQAQVQAQAQPGEMSPLGSSALPRRRLIPTSLKARLVSPQTTTTSMMAAQMQAQPHPLPQTPTLSSRRFLERTTASLADREPRDHREPREHREHREHRGVGEEHVQVQPPPHRTQRQLTLTRTGTTTVRRMTRETALPSLSSAASQVGYR